MIEVVGCWCLKLKPSLFPKGDTERERIVTKAVTGISCLYDLSHGNNNTLKPIIRGVCSHGNPQHSALHGGGGEGERVRDTPQVRPPERSVTGHRHRLHARRGRAIRRRFGEALLHTVRLLSLLRDQDLRQAQLWLHHQPQGHSGPAPLHLVQRR